MPWLWLHHKILKRDSEQTNKWPLPQKPVGQLQLWLGPSCSNYIHPPLPGEGSFKVGWEIVTRTLKPSPPNFLTKLIVIGYYGEHKTWYLYVTNMCDLKKNKTKEVGSSLHNGSPPFSIKSKPAMAATVEERNIPQGCPHPKGHPSKWADYTWVYALRQGQNQCCAHKWFRIYTPCKGLIFIYVHINVKSFKIV